MSPKPERQEFVTFYSPGSFFSESTTMKIASRDLDLAVAIAKTITERHSATPYGFSFETRIVAGPIDDGEGGLMPEISKAIVGSQSGVYFIGNVKVLSYGEIPETDGTSILRDNMRGNGWWFVAEIANRWTSTQPFRENDCVVNDRGEITQRGDSPERVEYRKKMSAEKAVAKC